MWAECVNGLFPRHHSRVWGGEGVEKGPPGRAGLVEASTWRSCSGGSPLAEVTLTPGGHSLVLTVFSLRSVGPEGTRKRSS